ncbi:MAG: 2-oxo acid dehydrogenase subunit E2 [Anaerolinea sp.]|nr:2-oxo acid dehydrogenase subunit E2 [Anaerolinea sp.]
MAFEVTMPQMGADMTEGTLVRWFKQVGEHVNRGEILAEIETDKANVELEAFEAGTVLKHVVAEGEVVPVGEIIALLGEAAEQVGDVERKPPAEAPGRRKVEPDGPAAASPAGVATAGSAAATPAAPGPNGVAANGRVRISPVAKRIASQAGLDITSLKGSGPDGRILRRDVEAAIAAPKPAAVPPTPPGAIAEVPRQAPPPARPEAAPAAPVTSPAQGLSKIRQAIARRMTLSKQTQPHYYLTLDIDMTAAMKFREQLNSSASEAQRVSVNDLVVKACAIALERHPKFNAEFGDNGLVMHDRINIDIGIALDEGLIAPAILDCGTKSLGRIATESKDLVERAKTGHLRADEYSEGTFTITNLGAYGVETLIGIINPPQAAILGVGSVMDQPVVRDGQVVPAKVMKVALSADHRVTDGAEGARFIKEIQGLLENPVSLAL